MFVGLVCWVSKMEYGDDDVELWIFGVFGDVVKSDKWVCKVVWEV